MFTHQIQEVAYLAADSSLQFRHKPVKKRQVNGILRGIHESTYMLGKRAHRKFSINEPV